MIRRMHGGRLPGRGLRCLPWLSAAYLRRHPGFAGLSDAFDYFYNQFLDAGNPAETLSLAKAKMVGITKEIDSLCADDN